MRDLSFSHHYFSGVGDGALDSTLGSLEAGSGGANSGGVEGAAAGSVPAGDAGFGGSASVLSAGLVDSGSLAGSVVLGGSVLDFSDSFEFGSVALGRSPASTSAAGLADASAGACPDGTTGDVASVVPVVGIVGSELVVPDIPPSAGAPIAGPVPKTGLSASAALKSDSVYHQTQNASKKIQHAAATIVIRVNKSPAFVPNALCPPGPPRAPVSPPPLPRCTKINRTMNSDKIKMIVPKKYCDRTAIGNENTKFT